MSAIFNVGTGLDAPTLNFSNNLSSYNPINYLQDPYYAISVDSSNLKITPSLRISSGYGFVGLCVDDGNNLAYAEAVAAKAEEYQAKITFAVSQYSVSQQVNYQQRLQSLINSGHDIIAHAYSDSSMISTGPIDVGGPAANSAVAVALGTTDVQLKNNGVDTDYTFVIGVDGTTVSELNAWINSKSGWLSRKYNASAVLVDDYAKLSGLKPQSTVVANGSYTNIPWLIDDTANTGFYLDEIKSPKTWLQNIIQSGAVVGSRAATYEVRYFAYPKGLRDKNSTNAVASVFLGARNYASGTDTTSLYMQSKSGESLGNIYRIGALSHTPGFMSMSETQTRANADAIAHQAVQGAFNFVVTHNTGQISIDQVGYIFDEWNKYKPFVTTTTVNSLIDIIIDADSAWEYKEADATNGGKMWGLKAGESFSSAFGISGLETYYLGTIIPEVHYQPAPNNVDLGGQEFNSMAINIGAYGIKDANGNIVARPTLKGMR